MVTHRITRARKTTNTVTTMAMIQALPQVDEAGNEKKKVK